MVGHAFPYPIQPNDCLWRVMNSAKGAAAAGLGIVGIGGSAQAIRGEQLLSVRYPVEAQATNGTPSGCLCSAFHLDRSGPSSRGDAAV